MAAVRGVGGALVSGLLVMALGDAGLSLSRLFCVSHAFFLSKLGSFMLSQP